MQAAELTQQKLLREVSGHGIIFDGIVFVVHIAKHLPNLLKYATKLSA